LPISVEAENEVGRACVKKQAKGNMKVNLKVTLR